MAGEHGSYVTREAIRQAFLRQIETKDVSQVRVSELTRDAHVSKTTFYRYYKDVYDLMADCFYVYLGPPQVDEGAGDARDAEFFSSMTFIGARNIKKFPRLFLMCHRCSYGPFKNDFAEGPFAASVSQTLDFMRQQGVTEQNCLMDMERLAYLCCDLSVDIYIRWIEGGLVETPEEMAEFTNTCIGRFIAAMVVNA